ncbi:immunoglobulin-like domain-containing protein [Georgenia alba]|uniref:Immunoglobulin-like domain-containing protein n=1 Tax=Georgenia alba TaxID=2233858 RepID=A0ABW2QCM4_9MICO
MRGSAREVTHTRKRGSHRAAVGTVAAAAMAGAFLTPPAAALPSDDSEALAKFLELSALDLEVADAVGAESGTPSDPTLNTATIDAEVLGGLLGVDVGLPGLPLIGDGESEGLLNLGPGAGAGVLNDFAYAPDAQHASAASGAVTDDGAIDSAAIEENEGSDVAVLELTSLLGQLGVDGLTDEVIDGAGLGIGALASRADAVTGSDIESQYVVSGLELRLSAPLIEGLTPALNQDLDTVSDTLNGVLGPDGTVQQALNAIDPGPVSVAGLVNVNLGSPTIDAQVDLQGVTEQVLTEPLVSDNGLVAIDLTTGDIVIDLEMLHGGNLSNLPANTQLLTEEEITQITDTVADLLGQLTDRVTTAVTEALLSTPVTITFPPSLSGIGGTISGNLDATISGTLGDFVGQTDTDPTVDITGNLVLDLPILPDVTVPINQVAGVLTPVLEQTVPTIGSALQPVLSAGQEAVTDVVGGTLADVVGTLDPVLEGILAELLTVVVNSQETAENGLFTVRALDVTVLPDLNAVPLPLASSSVRVQPLAPAVDATPGELSPGGTLTSNITGFVPDSTVTVTYTDADGNVVGTGTVELDTTGSGSHSVDLPEDTALGDLTVSVDDGAGNTASDVVSVVEPPAENTPPTLEGATDTSVEQGTEFDPMAGVTASDTEDGDLTDAVEVTGEVDTTTPGEYELTYTVTDSGGLTTSTTRTVTVTEPPNTAPVLEGVTDTSVEQGTEFDPMAGVTATDEQDGDLTDQVEVTGEVDTTTPGDYELTYTVTDSGGLTTTATRTVTVTEPPNTAPVLEGVTDTSVEQGTEFDPMAGVTATDEQDGDLTDQVEVTGEVDTTTPGDYELTYTVTDSDGATTTATRTVTVTEPPNTAPVIEGATNTSVEQGTEFDPMAGVTATDEQDGDLTSEVTVDGTVDTTTPGDYELTYTVTDSDGATTTATRTVTVTAPPNTAPVLEGVDPTSVVEGEDFDPMAGVTATDEQDGDLTDQVEVTGEVDTTTPGDYELTYTVTDSDGATTTATRTVTVTAAPNTAPVIEGATNVSVEQGTVFDPMAGVTATDEEDGDLTDAVEVEGTVDTSTPGDYELTYTVTDSDGATTTATRTVTVTAAPPANTPPVLEGVDPTSVVEGEDFDPMAGVTATDEQDGDLTSEVTVDGTVDTSTPGDYELTYTVTDSDGATTTATRTVTVTAAPNTPPVLEGVADTQVEQGSEFDPMAGVTATDEQDGDLTSEVTVDGTVDTTTPGDYELTYTVTDSDGATVSATRTVTVVEGEPEPEPTNTPPTLEGVDPTNVAEGEDFDPMDGVTATDAEDGDLTDQVEVTGEVDTTTPGEYELTYTVTDSDGSTVTATRVVTVTAAPNTAPALEGVQDATVVAGSDFDPMAGVTATDEEDGDLTDAVEVEGTVDTSTPGEYELTYTVTDSDGATVSATRTVTVTEPEPTNTPPTLEGVDATTVAEGEDFDPMAGVTATDAEDGDVTDQVEVTGEVDTTTPGEYELTYTVTDSDGSTVTATRVVTVTAAPNTAPALEGIVDAEITEGDDFDPMAGVTATDAEDGDLTDQVEVTGEVDTTTPGEYELTYTVTDSDGSTVTATRVVTVTAAPNTPPVLEGIDATSVPAGEDFDPMAGVTATDEQDGDLTSEVTVDGTVDTTTPGDYTLTYTVTDSGGSTVTATRVVTVTEAPNTPPVLDGVDATTVVEGEDFDPMAGVTATDEQDGDLTDQVEVTGEVDTTTPGDYELTYTVTDSDGSTVTATRVVTVTEAPNTPPVLDGVDPVEVETGTAFDPMDGVSATDEQDGDLTDQVEITGEVDTTTPGDYTLTYSVTDSDGSTVTVDRVVTVVQAAPTNTPPVLEGVGPVEVAEGSEFDPMAGVTATDEQDGDLTDQVEVTGEVDTTTPGDYELTYTVTDSSGATVTATRVVTVTEAPNTPPVLEGVADTQVEQGSEFDPMAGVTATDAEDGDLTDAVEVEGTVDTSTPGDYTLTYTVTDSDGTTVTASRTVTVVEGEPEPEPTNTPPTLEGVGPTSVVEGEAFDPMAGVTATDAEDGDLTSEVTVDGTVDTSTPGDYTLTYTVTDSDGSSVTATRVVTVTEAPNTPPVLEGVGDTAVEEGAPFDPMTGVSATDEEDGDLTDDIVVEGTVDTFTPGDYTLTYTVTDSDGTTVTATRTVTVTETPPANTPPVLDGVGSTSVEQGSVFDPMAGVTAMDAEDGDLTSEVTVDGTVDTSTPGDYELTYTVTDSDGTTVTATRVVTVTEGDGGPGEPGNTPPVLGGVDSVEVTEGEEFDPMDGVTATDAEDGDITDQVEVTGEVDTSTPGDYTLTYTVTDSDGTTVTATRTVTVTQAPPANTPPVLEGVGSTSVGEGEEFDPMDGVSATDAEDGDLTDDIVVEGTVDTSTPGDYTLTYTVTDSDGTTVTASRTVTVTEGDDGPGEPGNTPPVLEGVDTVVIEEGSPFDPMDGVSATDAEDGDLTDDIIVVGTFDPSTPGEYELTYTVTDSDGTTVTVSRTVIVEAGDDGPGDGGPGDGGPGDGGPGDGGPGDGGPGDTGPGDGPSVDAGPDVVAPGDEVTIDLDGFTPGSQVQVECELSNPGVVGSTTVTIGEDGSASATCTVPAGASDGELTVTAWEVGNSDATASDTVSVSRSGDLPDTGTGSAFTMALFSVVLALAGGLALLVRRRFTSA